MIIKLREGSLPALIVIVIVVMIIITADTLAAVTPSRWMHTVKYNHKSPQLTVTCRHYTSIMNNNNSNKEFRERADCESKLWAVTHEGFVRNVTWNLHKIITAPTLIKQQSAVLLVAVLALTECVWWTNPWSPLLLLRHHDGGAAARPRHHQG